jgi:dihydroorotase
MKNTIRITPAIMAVLAIALGSPAITFTQTTRYDLLLKGGHVIDPANHIDEARDVGILQGKIARVSM